MIVRFYFNARGARTRLRSIGYCARHHTLTRSSHALHPIVSDSKSATSHSLPNTQTRIASLRNGKRHPSPCPCTLGNAVGPRRGTVLEPSGTYVLLRNFAKGPTIFRVLVFHAAIPNVCYTSTSRVAQLMGDRFKLRGLLGARGNQQYEKQRKSNPSSVSHCTLLTS